MSRDITVLLVEDNPADIKLTTLALQKTNIVRSIQVLKDGKEALAYLRRQGQYEEVVLPDLILLDLNLPGKSGHEVLAEIKADSNLTSIPVVILTSSDDNQDIRRAHDCYADFYITKPVDLQGFSAVGKSIEDFWSGLNKEARQ